MAKKKTKKQWRGCDARGEETRTAPHERTALKGRGPGIWVWPGGVHSSKGQGFPKQTNKQGYQYQYCRMGMPVLPGTRQTTRGGDRNGIQVHSGQEGLLCTAGGGWGGVGRVWVPKAKSATAGWPQPIRWQLPAAGASGVVAFKGVEGRGAVFTALRGDLWEPATGLARINQTSAVVGFVCCGVWGTLGVGHTFGGGGRGGAGCCAAQHTSASSRVGWKGMEGGQRDRGGRGCVDR